MDRRTMVLGALSATLVCHGLLVGTPGVMAADDDGAQVVVAVADGTWQVHQEARRWRDLLAAAPRPVAAATHRRAQDATVIAGTPGQVADALSRQLFQAARAHVIHDPDQPAASLSTAAVAGLPLLEAPEERWGRTIRVRAGQVPGGVGLDGLQPVAADDVVAQLRRRVLLDDGVTLPAALQTDPTPTVHPPGASGHPDLHRTTGPGDALVVVSPADPAAAVAVAVALAADADVLVADGLRTNPTVLAALADHDGPVLVVDSAGALQVRHWPSQLAAARTGTQLPGGGQLILDDGGHGKLYVALYGHPSGGALGVLGEAGLDAAVRRVTALAGQYQQLTQRTVVPTFEIIATVATAAAGPDGDYSSAPDLELIEAWVDRAEVEGIYVLLDLQPGRSDFPTQAQQLEELLARPHVGLALDPEWRLECPPRCRHLEQIGQVGVEEVTQVAAWLDELTASHELPDKLLLLHQFRTTMLRERARLPLDWSHLSVAVQMDGQGPQPMKDDTWGALTGYGPDGLVFGWKNFHDEDSPMLDPAGTLAKRPTPVLVSYQ